MYYVDAVGPDGATLGSDEPFSDEATGIAFARMLATEPGVAAANVWDNPYHAGDPIAQYLHSDYEAAQASQAFQPKLDTLRENFDSRGMAFTEPFANPTPAGPLTGDDLSRSMRLGLASELDAISLYDADIDRIEDESIRKALTEIRNDEKDHAHKFEALLEQLDPYTSSEPDARALHGDPYGYASNMPMRAVNRFRGASNRNDRAYIDGKSRIAFLYRTLDDRYKPSDQIRWGRIIGQSGNSFWVKPDDADVSVNSSNWRDVPFNDVQQITEGNIVIWDASNPLDIEPWKSMARPLAFTDEADARAARKPRVSEPPHEYSRTDVTGHPSTEWVLEHQDRPIPDKEKIWPGYRIDPEIAKRYRPDAYVSNTGDTVFYHGTRSRFDIFSPHYRKGQQLGFGIHFTTDKSFAERYATDPDVRRRGKYPRVIAVHLDVHNPLRAAQIVTEGTPEFELAEHLAGSRLQTQKNMNGERQAWLQGAIDATGPDRAERIIREAGYDAVIYDAELRHFEYGGYTRTAKAETYIVFDPSQIHVIGIEPEPTRGMSVDSDMDILPSDMDDMPPELREIAARVEELDRMAMSIDDAPAPWEPPPRWNRPPGLVTDGVAGQSICKRVKLPTGETLTFREGVIGPLSPDQESMYCESYEDAILSPDQSDRLSRVHAASEAAKRELEGREGDTGYLSSYFAAMDREYKQGVTR